MSIPIQLIFCTCPDRHTAETLARKLVNEGLAACVNILPNVLSIYHWQGQLEISEEQLLLIKAREDHYLRIEKALKDHHPYEVPEIIAVPVQQGLPAYLEWINSCPPAK
jgi:periplasmic divalent cation tolerance protein